MATATPDMKKLDLLAKIEDGPFAGFPYRERAILEGGASPASVKAWALSLLRAERRAAYNRANAIRRRIAEIEALPDVIQA
jgi:transposase